MMRDAVLALGVLLSTATQLRPGSSPIGPGEVCLAGWLVMSFAPAERRRGNCQRGLAQPDAGLLYMLGFWALFAVAEAVGTLVGFSVDRFPDMPSLLHDVMAYVLMAAVSCISVGQADAARRMQRSAWFLTGFGALFLLCQLANAWGFVAISGISPWYWDRLRGWSDNPNQFALTCVVLGLVSLHVAETARHGLSRLAGTGCAGLAFYVGVLTKSDALLMVFAVGFVLLVVLKLRGTLGRLQRQLGIPSAAAWIFVLSLPLLVVGMLPALSRADKAADATVSLYKSDHNGEAAVRFLLWGAAFERGLDSGMLGLGPGPHVVRIPYKREPPPNFEAHNTLLDLWTQGGALAVGSVIWLMWISLFATLKVRLAALTTLVCGLAVFSTFHLIVRMPTFWFAIVLALVPMPATPPAVSVES